MDVRAKLVELLCLWGVRKYISSDTGIGMLAAFLAIHGVTVQELDGCEYCKDSKSVYYHSSGVHDSMDEDVYISGNNIVVDIGCHSYGTAEIKFCPMCGRELPKRPKGE